MEDNLENVEEITEVETPVEKTYTEKELEEAKAQARKEIEDKQQANFDKRWARKMEKLEKEKSRQDEYINMLMSQTGAKTFDELEDITYEQYELEKPKRKESTRDDEILGKYDAQEILELDDDSILEEANRLASIDRSPREEATFMALGEYLTKKKNEMKFKNEFKENGIDENLLNDEEFKSFAKKFNKETSAKEIYDLYSQTHKKDKPFSLGSISGTKSNDSELFTEEEFLALTAKDLENPKIYEKAMKSRLNFGK